MKATEFTPFLSSLLAVVAVVVWPLFNTFLSIWLAVAAVLAGIAGLLIARRPPTLGRYAFAGTGIALGGGVVLFWLFVIFLAWGATTGSPL